MNRSQWFWITAIAAILSSIGFQSGRYSVTWGSSPATRPVAQPNGTVASAAHSRLYSTDNHQLIIANIAGIPFAEVYDILRTAPPEQILKWAEDLEHLANTSQRQAALDAFYRTLVQIDVSLATQALIQTRDRRVRDTAFYAMKNAAPESAWSSLAEAALAIPHRKGRARVSDILADWGRVDPIATSEFLEKHPDETDYGDFFVLMTSWGNIDPVAAVNWIEAKPQRQSRSAISGVLMGWLEVDRPGAIRYALTNAVREEFTPGMVRVADRLFRTAPDDGRAFVESLPAKDAHLALEQLAEYGTGIFIGSGRDLQLSPDEVARWMITLPPELWKDHIGRVVSEWNRRETATTTQWLDGLPQNLRDTVTSAACASGDTDAPADVLALAKRIVDYRLRSEALSKFVSRAVAAGPDAVAKLKQLDLPAAEKRNLLNLLAAAQNGQ